MLDSNLNKSRVQGLLQRIKEIRRLNGKNENEDKKQQIGT